MLHTRLDSRCPRRFRSLLWNPTRIMFSIPAPEPEPLGLWASIIKSPSVLRWATRDSGRMQNAAESWFNNPLYHAQNEIRRVARKRKGRGADGRMG